MLLSFCRYFFSYVFHAKTRQKLLFLAVFGLFLSSFSLLVLQSTMGGLQHNLITRSKSIDGSAIIHLRKGPSVKFKKIFDYLKNKNIQFNSEYELELLIRHRNYLSPIIVHGIDPKSSHGIPPFLDGKEFEDMIIGMDLASKIGASFGSKVQIISPAHVDAFFGDIPRSAVLYLDELIRTDVPEVDLFNGWVRLPLLQNLTREVILNRIRIYNESEEDLLELKDHLKSFPEIKSFDTWEAHNQTLVWALKLESMVMIFLFIAMTLLVSLCITSGLLIFFEKIKIDLASFWILGTSRKKLERASSYFLVISCNLSIVLGLIFALIFLYYFDIYGAEILPDVFVDRKIPIHITSKGIFISFAVPTIISTIFTFISVKQFKRDQSYLNHVRSVG
jgi:lipoprotein-releasing system permease protein